MTREMAGQEHNPILTCTRWRSPAQTLILEVRSSPPSNGYASFNVPFEINAGFPSGFRGGVFWNGRSEGELPLFGAATRHIGDEVFKDVAQKALYGKYLGPVADQALNPFLNDVEQNDSERGVCRSVKLATYAPLFKKAWGEPINCTAEVLDKDYKRIAVALAAYQSSSEVNSFSSKRDMALRNEADGAFPLKGLTAKENRGHDLFYNTLLNPKPGLPVTNCALCHSNAVGLDTGVEPLQTYTDFSYHVIGVPANPEIPGYPILNEGLEDHTGVALTVGAQKTPTLRNVDKRVRKGFVKAYTHNGWFKSLESIVHFYNTGALLSTASSFGITRCRGDVTEEVALRLNCWPAPEFPNAPLLALTPIPIGPGLTFTLIGDMGLTAEDEAALVAYLKTFTDYDTPEEPPPYK